MFTGIVQATAQIAQVQERTDLRSFTLDFPPGFCQDLAIGASVAVDGVCLTVTHIVSPTQACFDVMGQTLAVTTLGDYGPGQRVNVERAAKEGAEIGGHPLSGHIDGMGTLIARRVVGDNLIWRIEAAPEQRPYLFARGYVAIHGASLTIADADRQQGWLEIWLIPETRRATVFEAVQVGGRLNIEIERSTQVMVDTVRETVQAHLKDCLQELLASMGDASKALTAAQK